MLVSETIRRPSPELLLAKLQESERAKLRLYLGAAPGVGKTFQMLEDAKALKRQGVDIVIAFICTVQCSIAFCRKCVMRQCRSYRWKSRMRRQRMAINARAFACRSPRQKACLICHSLSATIRLTSRWASRPPFSYAQSVRRRNGFQNRAAPL